MIATPALTRYANMPISWIRNVIQPQTETITVAKPICMPVRAAITGVLAPYEIRHWYDYDYYEVASYTGIGLYHVAQLRVNRAAAAWAEYVLLRSGRFKILSRPKNRRNREWAQRHHNTLPRPWAVKVEAWREPKCKTDPVTGQPYPI